MPRPVSPSLRSQRKRDDGGRVRREALVDRSIGGATGGRPARSLWFRPAPVPVVVLDPAPGDVEVRPVEPDLADALRRFPPRPQRRPPPSERMRATIGWAGSNRRRDA